MARNSRRSVNAHQLTADEARKLLDYNPSTGEFFNRVARGNMPAGARADGPASRGYRQIAIDGRTYKAHRVAWLMMKGQWPSQTIDHRNGSRGDNRFTNLRDISESGNQENRRQANKQNRTGLLGVTPHKRGFQARIRVKGRLQVIGTFTNAEDAHQAYVERKRAVHAGGLL